ncbi:hypothetical protein FGO68_gene13712 [Halteria grandinella]|uniref:ATP synthase protein MI25 n=1 Tax=Halteria grandinella TaxID=5974 RepID=A0A8J8P6Z6_HALGN|nr:hypothetical protein FGO68_gene13712 [Halteria grandinella]
MVTYYLIFMLLLTDITSDYDVRVAIGMIELAIIGLCVLSNIFKAALAGINELRRRRAQKRKRELLQLFSRAPKAAIKYTDQTKLENSDIPSASQDPRIIPIKQKKIIRLIMPTQIQVKVPASVTREIVRKISNDTTISDEYSEEMFQTPLQAYQIALQRVNVSQIWEQSEIESERQKQSIWKNT